MRTCPLPWMNFRTFSAISVGRFRKTSVFAKLIRNRRILIAHGRAKARCPNYPPWDSRKPPWTSGRLFRFGEEKRRGGTVLTNGCGIGLVYSATRKPETSWWERIIHPSCRSGWPTVAFPPCKFIGKSKGMNRKGWPTRVLIGSSSSFSGANSSVSLVADTGHAFL